MIRTPAVGRIVVIAEALLDLPEPILFVGASVLGLLATEQGSPTPRSTEDVDIVALVTDYAQNATLNEHLRARGFSEEVGNVICRWRYRGWIVDVMPPDPSILGFSNELYPSALEHPSLAEIDGVIVRHIDAPHFIGTKLLAFEGRGKGDLFASHDLEDLLAVINSRPEAAEDIKRAPADCRDIVLPRLGKVRAHPLFEEVLEGHLANDVPGQVEIVLARIDAILKAG